MAALFALALAAAWQPALACNPSPPRPPVLEGYDWDETAAEVLLRDARSVVAARFKLRVDTETPAGADPLRAGYVFEVLEGWKAETARRLTLGGYWLSCELTLEPGRVFLLFLDGDRLLHAVPAERLDFEFGLLGEADWFYDAAGRLHTP
jgi:hypothetical protein